MIKFNKPESLNGSQLREELNNAGIKLDNEIGSISIDENGDLFLSIAKQDEAKAKPIIDAHVGVDQTIAIAEAKAALLAKLGITAEEAQLLLA